MDNDKFIKLLRDIKETKSLEDRSMRAIKFVRDHVSDLKDAYALNRSHWKWSYTKPKNKHPSLFIYFAPKQIKFEITYHELNGGFYLRVETYTRVVKEGPICYLNGFNQMDYGDFSVLLIEMPTSKLGFVNQLWKKLLEVIADSEQLPSDYPPAFDRIRVSNGADRAAGDFQYLTLTGDTYENRKTRRISYSTKEGIDIIEGDLHHGRYSVSRGDIAVLSRDGLLFRGIYLIKRRDFEFFYNPIK